MGDKYLSEVLAADDILKNESNRLCILAGVGAGKNYFVMNALRGHGNIFFVSSRRATVNQMLLDELCNEKVDWDKYDDEILTTTNYGVELLVKNQRFSTTGIKNLIEHYKIIVIDEFHSLNADATFSNSAFHVYTFLDYISENYPEIKIVVMTGTEEPVKEILERDKYKIIDKRDDCINVIPKCIHVISRKEAIEIIKVLPEGKKTIYYTNSARSSIVKAKNGTSLFEKLCSNSNLDETNVAFAIADETARKIMTENKIPSRKKESDETYYGQYNHLKNLDRKVKLFKKYITKKNRLPQRTKVVIATSTLKEGININSKDISIAFCESHLLSDIQQFAGRFREGLDILYIVNDAKQFDIKDDEMKRKHLEMYFNFKMLHKINDFLSDAVKTDTSLLYRNPFATYKSNEIELCNFFYLGDWSIYSTNECAKTYIDLVEEIFPYVRFNHLKSKFEMFVNAFKEQVRIYQYFKKGWETSVCLFCKEKGILYVNQTSSKTVNVDYITEALSKLVGVKMINSTQKQKLKTLLATEFGLNSKQPQITTLNRYLHDYDIPYKLYQGNTQGKRYIEVRSISI